MFTGKSGLKIEQEGKRMDEKFFLTVVKLAYRRVGSSDYSFETVWGVLQYYDETYRLIFGKSLPPITVDQAADCIRAMPFVEDDFERTKNLTPEDYRLVIDQHFATRYGPSCNYSLQHFFSGAIRTHRVQELQGQLSGD